MNTHRQAGFGVVAIIAAILVVAVAGLIGWRLYSLYSKSATTTKTSHTTSSDQNNNQNSNDTTIQQTDPNAGYVVIKEWNVRFKPVDGLTDVIYASGPSMQTINFSTGTLKALDPNCDPSKAPAVGGVERTTAPYNDPQGPHPQSLGLIGGYYYYYDSPQSTCSDTKSVQDAETQQTALLKQSVMSLEAAK